MKRIYLDFAATTPVDPKVVKAMQPYFSGVFGNPSSLHRFGQEASAAVFKARRAIAEAIGADYREIVFTGSATEANNLALRGTTRKFWWDFLKQHEKTLMPKTMPHIIAAAIEHESILATVRDIEQRGAAKVTIVPVDKNGMINLTALKGALKENTVLVSVMYANNEVGTIQPIAEIAKIIHDFRKSSVRGKAHPFFHTDAVQALQYLDCNVNRLGVDLMTLSAHKIYGPKGIGALYMRRETHNLRHKENKPHVPCLTPQVTGGGQEFGLRSGTENVPYVVGFAKAVEITVKMRKHEAERVRSLRDRLLRGIKKIIPRAVVNGSIKMGERLPSNLNIYIPQRNANELLIKLDLLGIAVSAGPACASRAAKPASALLALGASEKRALSSIRITLGRPTTAREIDKALKAIKMIITRY